MEYLVVVTYVIFTRWRKLLPGGYIFILIPLLKKYFKMNNIHFIWYFENCNWKRNTVINMLYLCRTLLLGLYYEILHKFKMIRKSSYFMRPYGWWFLHFYITTGLCIICCRINAVLLVDFVECFIVRKGIPMLALFSDISYALKHANF